MCAHRVIGASLIGLTCAAVVASTLVEIGPDTTVISADPGEASASGCDPRIVHNYKPLPTAEEARRHTLIVGNWVGETAVEGGGKRRFLAEHFDDGSFRVTLRTRWPDGSEERDQLVGEWGLSGPIFFTTVTGFTEHDDVVPADPGDPYNYNAYEVIELDDDYFEYESFSPRARYTVRRIAGEITPEVFWNSDATHSKGRHK